MAGVFNLYRAKLTLFLEFAICCCFITWYEICNYLLVKLFSKRTNHFTKRQINFFPLVMN